MNTANLEIIIILVLVLANGVLAMSEMALVSARSARLEPLARAGNARARMVTDLIRAPGTFLSTVQIGVTLIGILIGVFGGGMVAQSIAPWLTPVPLIGGYAQGISVGIVVVITTYLSLVLGELVPKRLALRYPESISMAMVLPLRVLARITYPMVKLLDWSTHAVLTLLRIPTDEEVGVSEDEVRYMLRQGTDLGVFEPLEHDMVGRVFRLADQKMGALLTPRTEIVWLDEDDSHDEILAKVLESGRSRFPVAKGELDQVTGIVLAKDLLAQYTESQKFSLKSILRPAIFVPETAPALTVIERMKLAQSKIALVIDEYGGLAGLVTIEDVIGAIVGEMIEEGESLESMAIEREDGSWLVDGMMTTAEFSERFEVELGEVDRLYMTVGGLVMTALGKVPVTGDVSTWMNLHLEVIDMDGRRVDKVMVRKMTPAEIAAATQETQDALDEDTSTNS
ncbi:MAG: hemolysin family protein [Litorilinea sp.]